MISVCLYILYNCLSIQFLTFILLHIAFKPKLIQMKEMLTKWRAVTEREYPEFVDLIPHPDQIDLSKLENGGVMTDTCNSAQKANRLLAATIDGIVHSMFCHNHLRNVWVKNVLDSLTDFMRAHLNDSLDEIAPELRVSPSFISLARAFDKMFSLCANYPKGMGEAFRQWMKLNHSGELLFHVERAASGGRQDIASMAAMAIFWNKNYCIEFLDEMISYCGKHENILARNLMILLSSVEINAVSRLWSILHIAIVMPIRWLAAKTHEMKDYGWGYISMGKVLDKLKEDLELIVGQPELIHDESFMMGMMDEWADELPPFREYLDHKFHHQKTSYFNDASKIKAVPLMELRKELFTPTDQDNKDSTPMLEELVVVAATRWIEELLDTTKATYPLMSVSGGEYSWDGSSDNLKKAFLGMMAVNDLAESAFAGVTAQLQVFGRIDMSSAAAISDMARNGFLDRPTTKKEMSGKKTSLFHDLPEELQITAMMCAMEEAPATRESNNNALEKQRESKRERDELVKQGGLEKATNGYIKCLIYREMWGSDRHWKTSTAVKKGVKSLTLK